MNSALYPCLFNNNAIHIFDMHNQEGAPQHSHVGSLDKAEEESNDVSASEMSEASGRSHLKHRHQPNHPRTSKREDHQVLSSKREGRDRESRRERPSTVASQQQKINNNRQKYSQPEQACDQDLSMLKGEDGSTPLHGKDQRRH